MPRFRRGSAELDRVIVQPSGDGDSLFIDLAVGADGRLYVLDAGRGEVLSFTIDGPGQREVLVDLSADSSHKGMSMAVSPSGDVAVLTEGAELLLYAGAGAGVASDGGPVTARAEPRPAPEPSALTQEYLSEDGLRTAFVGNTIETLQRRRIETPTVLIYFGTDGQAEYLSASSGVRSGRWWIIPASDNKDALFCRRGTDRSRTAQFCERVTLEGDNAVFYNTRRPPVHMFSARILKGRQIP